MNIQTNINRTQHITYSTNNRNNRNHISNKKMTTTTTNTNTTATNTTQQNNYDDSGSFDVNNISQVSLCNSKYMHITPHSYILCIPRLPYTTTKMDVARAVENEILKSGKGKMSDIQDFKYVQNVTFVRAFDQFTFDALTTSKSSLSSSLLGAASAGSYDPWYKIAIVKIDIVPSYNNEYGVEFYTTGEDAFYSGVCRGDIVINSWSDAFFLTHPRNYFQHVSAPGAAPGAAPKPEKKEVCEYQGGAFHTWKNELKLKQLERKVKEYENTIRQNELDAIVYQNTINDFAESMRFLTRKMSHSPDLHGLTCSSNQVVSYISALNNRYARVCISDTSFLEANRNMKLKQMNGHVINACDDCDACQELIHSIDHTRAEDREQVFNDIEKMVCRVNKNVQKFEKLHLHAERSLFGLRNRRVFEDFGAYLNTALEIVEEVTSRISTFTQDLEYARCYGQLYYNHHASSASSTVGYYNYDYDYSEDADQVDDASVSDSGIVESTQKMLQYFDEHHRVLYKEQEQQEQQQEEPSPTLNLDASSCACHEEAVIIEGEGEEGAVKSDNKVEETVVAAAETAQETQQNKKSGWLSWF